MHKSHYLVWGSILYLALCLAVPDVIFKPTLPTLPLNQTSTWSGTVDRLPQVDELQQRVFILPDQQASRVYLKVPRYPTLQYGDRVAVICTLQLPSGDIQFYLYRFRAATICTKPQVTLLSTTKSSSYNLLRTIFIWRNHLLQQMQRLWPDPTAGIVAGLVIGAQDSLSEDIQLDFRRSGIIHILVVSGMHVALVIGLIKTSLERWCSPWQLLLLAIIFIMGLCVMTGLSSSVIRAGIMGSLPLLARALERPSHTGRAIIMSAAIMAISNPWIVRYDIGFQLSFAATVGLVYLQPWFRWISRSATIQTTLAATTATAPLLLYHFGSFSLIGLATNIIVIPLSTSILFASAAVIIVGAVYFKAGLILAYPVHRLTQVMVDIAQWSSQWDQAIIMNHYLPGWAVLTIYGSFLIYCVWYERYLLS